MENYADTKTVGHSGDPWPCLGFLQHHIRSGSLLDVGCGPKDYSNPFIGICDKIVTVDAWESVHPDVVLDLEKESLLSKFKENEFDYILLLDFIEHLDKEIGFKVIEDCKVICKQKMFMLTPMWWNDNIEPIHNESLWCYGNQFCAHKSLWTKEDFADWVEVDINAPNYYTGYFIAGDTK